MKDKSLQKYIKKLFISYFFILAVPLFALVLLYVYNLSSNMIAENDTEMQFMLNEDIDKFNHSIEATFNYTLTLSRDIEDIIDSPFDKSLYEYGELMDTLNTIIVNDNSILDISVYIKEHEKILNTSTIIDYADFDDKSLFDNDKPFIVSSTNYLEKNTPIIILNSKVSNKNITFVYYLESLIEDTVFDLETFIISNDGQIIYGDENSEIKEIFLNYEFTEEISDKNTVSQYVFLYEHISFSDSYLIKSYSLDKIYEAIVPIFIFTGIFVILLLGLVIYLSWSITKHNTKPVVKFINHLAKIDTSKIVANDIFEKATKTLTLLCDENDAYRVSLGINLEIIKNQMIRDLLLNNVPYDLTIEEFLANGGVMTEFKGFTPVIIIVEENLSKSRSSSEVNSLIKNIFIEELSDKIEILGACISEFDKIVFLINCNKDREYVLVQEKIRKTYDSIRKITEEKLNIHTRVVIGYSVNNSENLFKQYVTINKTQMNNAKQVTYFEENENGLIENNNPTFIRKSLLDAIKSNDSLGIEQNISRLFDDASTNDESTCELAFAVVGNVLTELIDDDVKVNIDILSIYKQNDDVLIIKEKIINSLLELSNQFEQNTVKEEENIYVNQAKIYIENNIHKDISLFEIAEYVNINRSYFSRIFKNSTGMTPLQYMTNLRIEKAKIMLREEEISIKEISTLLGYNDMRSFIRFFKKLENQTPSEYRERK